MIDVFLKYNRDTFSSVLCLKRWIDIFEDHNITIVCDLFDENNTLPEEYKKFIPSNIKIIKTDYSLSQPFTHLLKTSRWHRVAASNLVCWEKSISQHFWIIDADDTIFLSDVNLIKQKIKNCEKYFLSSNLDGISLDFYREIKKDHWSFGMVLFKKQIDLKKLATITPDDLSKHKGLILNLDSVFDYARRSNMLNLKSFVFDNCYFQHHLEQNCLPWGVYFWTQKSIWGTIPLKDDIAIF